MHSLINEFAQTIAENYVRLAIISNADATAPRAAGKWSPKEIIGHLIDSAANNHQRFVRAQLSDNYDSLGYEQESWVAVQAYQDAAWLELLTLWKVYNEHLIRIIALIPDDKLNRTFRIASEEPVTLDYWVEDYLRHMQKHLGQILN
jgi:DinB superfamily